VLDLLRVYDDDDSRSDAYSYRGLYIVPVFFEKKKLPRATQENEDTHVYAWPNACTWSMMSTEILEVSLGSIIIQVANLDRDVTVLVMIIFITCYHIGSLGP